MKYIIVILCMFSSVFCSQRERKPDPFLACVKTFHFAVKPSSKVAVYAFCSMVEKFRTMSLNNASKE